MKNEQRQEFVQLLADLLEQGFSINEALRFLEKGAFFEQKFLRSCQKGLKKGRPLYEIFRKNGFKEEIVLQIRLADIHGNLSGTLKNISQQLLLVGKQQKNLRKTLTYPAVLIFFLLLILFAFRQVILPQLLLSGMVKETDATVLFLDKLPLVLVTLLIIGLLIFCSIQRYFKQKSALKKAAFFCRIPVIKDYYRMYLSSFFALEWGKLFQEGLEMRQIIDCMKAKKEKNIMSELANLLEKQLAAGESFTQIFATLPFFTKEFSTILKRGTLKGTLGTELVFYSDYLWQKFFQKIERLLIILQPIVFVVIAILIVVFYAALLLPIYGNLGGDLS